MGELPDGVLVLSLKENRDHRGTFTEIFRKSWQLGQEPVQWNLVRSKPGVVRGVHVHVIHRDYWLLVSGHATVGLRDLRKASPTSGMAVVIEAYGEKPNLIVVPRGIAHGFQYHEASVHLYSVTHYWDRADELGCRWDDPRLEIPWPAARATLSEKDRLAKGLSDLEMELAPYQGELYEPHPDPV